MYWKPYRCALDFTLKVSIHVTKHLHVIGNYDTEFVEDYSEFITIALWLRCHANTHAVTVICICSLP